MRAPNIREATRPACVAPKGTRASPPLAVPQTMASALRALAKSGGGVGRAVVRGGALIRLMVRGIMRLHHPGPCGVLGGSDTLSWWPTGS